MTAESPSPTVFPSNVTPVTVSVVGVFVMERNRAAVFAEELVEVHSLNSESAIEEIDCSLSVTWRADAVG